MKHANILFIGISLLFLLRCANDEKDVVLKVEVILNRDNSKEVGKLRNGKKSGVWKTFSSKGNLVKVEQFERGAKQFDLDREDFIYNKIEFDERRASIEAPSEWELMALDSLGVLIALRKNCLSGPFCPSLTITSELLPEGTDFGDYVELTRSMLQQGLESYEAVANGRVLVNQIGGFQEVSTFIKDGLKLGGLITWIDLGNEVYIINLFAYDGDTADFFRYKDLFREISQSFKVEY